jgi:hypothetical protein
MRLEAVGSNGMTNNYQGLDNTHDDNRLVDMLGIGFRVFPSKARELGGRSLWLKGDTEEVWRLKGFRHNFCCHGWKLIFSNSWSAEQKKQRTYLIA